MSKYKRDDKEFKASIAARVKPFRKHEDKIVTVTIDDNGDVLFLATEVNDVFLNQGTVVTRRASHVEPGPRYERWLFHLLRALFGDKGRVSDWTRTWNTLWRVNTKPVGGPILTVWHATEGRTPSERIMYWNDRQAAINAEVAFLNEWFLERGIQ